MSVMIIETSTKSVSTTIEPKVDIGLTSENKYVTSTVASNVDSKINLSTTTNDISLTNNFSDIIVNENVNMITINNDFNLNSIEILIKDVIANNPSTISGSSAAARIENLLINKNNENGKYYIVTSNDIEGDLLNLLITFDEEHIDYIGVFNIVNKRIVEFNSDIDLLHKNARITYIKKV